MSTLLVIGGTGFFGKSILDSFRRGALEKWGVERVIAMSRNAERLRKEAPQLISSSVELYSADIATSTTLPAADIVIHAATSTDTAKYISRLSEVKEHNLAGMENFCDLAKTVHTKSKILYVSSGAVYGKQPISLSHISEEYIADDLSELPEGKREYAAAKCYAEDAIKNLGKSGLSVSIARCFAFVGPWLPRNQHYAVGNFIEDGLTGRPISVQARKKVYRSYMYPDDLVEWLMAIAADANALCPVYNVGSNQAVEIRTLAEIVAGEFNVDVQLPEITDSTIDRYIPSIDKAFHELGLTLHYDLISAIQQTIRSCKEE